VVMLRVSVGRNRYAGGQFPLLDGARTGRAGRIQSIVGSINRACTGTSHRLVGRAEAAGDGDPALLNAALFDRSTRTPPARTSISRRFCSDETGS
jgi:hypothetical protein